MALSSGFDSQLLNFGKSKELPTIRVFPVGPTRVNCILICCNITRDCIVIDPGADAETIVNEIQGI